MVSMVTTQFDVLLFVGERQLVSCSVFVPVPLIVVKSHHVIANNILPALPLERLALPFPFSILRRPTVNATPKQSPPSNCNQLVALARPSNPPTHSSSPSCPSASTALTTVSSNSNALCHRSDPGTACLKISLRPKPSFSFLRVQHYSIMTYEEEQHYFINRPIRLIPQLFTYPFPPYGHHFPGQVIVTGNFDQWQRTVHLKENRDLNRWEAKVDINVDQLTTTLGDHPQQRKLLYKFVLDGDNWVTDPNQPLERDNEGNLNNVLLLDIEQRFGWQHADKDEESQQQQQSDQPLHIEDLKEEEGEEVQPAPSIETVTPATVAPAKEEDKNDKIIRDYGMGMWGAPHFAVNDQIQLPSHFAQDSEDITSAQETSSSSTTALPSHQGLALEAPMELKAAAEATQEQQQLQQQKCEEEGEDDKIIREYGQGMWGFPHFQINDNSPQLPDQFSEASLALPPLLTATMDTSLTTSSTSRTLVASGDYKPTQDMPVLEPLTEMTAKTMSIASGHEGTINARESVISATTLSPSLHNSSHPDEHKGDNDSGVVILQGEPIIPNGATLSSSNVAAANDLTKPTADASILVTDASREKTPLDATPAIMLLGRHNTLKASTAAPTMAVSTSLPDLPSETSLAWNRATGDGKSLKSGKKKMGFWKKIKRALS